MEEMGEKSKAQVEEVLEKMHNLSLALAVPRECTFGGFGCVGEDFSSRSVSTPGTPLPPFPLNPVKVILKCGERGYPGWKLTSTQYFTLITPC